MSWQKSFEKGKTSFKTGKYADAYQSLKEAHENAQGKASDEELGEVKYELGRAARRAAKFEEASEVLSSAKELFEDTKGDESLECAKVLNEIGLLNQDQYKFVEAEAAHQQCYAIRKKLLKEPDKSIAESLNDLGLLFWRKGNDIEAFKYYNESLDMRGKTVGEEHEDYAETLDNIGILHVRCDEVTKAEEHHRRSLAIREKCLGEEHPETAYSIVNLAQALERQGHPEQFETMYKRAIGIWERTLGEEHPDTSTAWNNLGLYYLNKGKLHDAEGYFKRSLEVKERLLGEDNPRVTVNLHNLAIVYSRLNRKAEAEKYSNRAVRLMEKQIEEGGEGDIETVIMLSDTLNTNGKHEEAEALLLKALAKAESDFGTDSSKSSRLLQFLGGITITNQPERAKDYFIRMLRIRKKTLGDRHPNIAEALRLVAMCFTHQGDNTTAGLLNSQARAIEFESDVEDPEQAVFRMLVEQHTSVHGDDDPTALQTKKMLAQIHKMNGNDEEADKLMEEYLTGIKQKHGAESMEYAEELLMIGMGSAGDLDHEKAIKELSECLAIQEKILGEHHPDLNTVLNMISSSYEMLEKDDEREKICKKLLLIAEKDRGEDHWSVRGPLLQLKTIAEKKGDADEAAKLQARMDAIPEPTALEQSEEWERTSKRMMNMLFKGLEGLTALAEIAGAEETTGTTDTEL